MQPGEELFVLEQFGVPVVTIDRHRLGEIGFAEIFEAFPRDVLMARHPTQRRLGCIRLALGSTHDPLEDAHVLAESWPDELAVVVLAEPVHTEDSWWIRDVASERKPVIEVVTHVVAGKGQHGEGISTNHTLGTEGRCRRL